MSLYYEKFINSDFPGIFSPHISQAKTACETCAFAAKDCGKSFGAVLAHLARSASLRALSIVETAQDSSKYSHAVKQTVAFGRLVPGNPASESSCN